MKIKLSIAWIGFTFSFTFLGVCSETNFDFVIEWKQPVTNAIHLSEAPPLIYRTTKLTTVTNVVISCAWIKKVSNGKAEWTQSADRRPHSISGKTGEIDTKEWAFLRDGLLKVLEHLTGTGILRVAVFEAQKSHGPGLYDTGRQVSDWIELPIWLSD
jgi:hypothetical protein